MTIDADVDTGHDYDGIREYDNRLPRWWLYTLWGAVIFTFGYWGYYETSGIGLTQYERLAVENEQASKAEDEKLARLKARGEDPFSDEALVALAATPDARELGAKVWKTNCVACHKEKGEGLIGPNLTDAVALHDSSPSGVFKVISEGVLSKGMPAWKKTLGLKKTRAVTAHVLGLALLNVAGKAPQGKQKVIRVVK